MYGRVVAISTLASGALYSLGYLSFDIREVMSDGVPMEPPVLGITVLFCLGAAIGLSLAEGFAPSAYVVRQIGSSSVAQMWYRSRRFVVVTLILTVTAVVLYFAFLND
jgi:hypothetical protein